MTTNDGRPGELIVLEGTLNLRDLGGWTTELGGEQVALGQVFRSDRLSDLTSADHERLSGFGIDTVIDLRYEAEVAEHPSLLWPEVTNHHEFPMGGDLADQRSFIERAFSGEFEGLTDSDVGESYVEMLAGHATGFGQAVEAVLGGGPSLFHCTAGKDRTGLLAMLILRTVGVSEPDVLADFEFSNQYRAERRMAQLRPVFEAEGLDIERFRPALSAPRPAMERALSWVRERYGTAEGFLTDGAQVANAGVRLRSRLLEPTAPPASSS